MITTHIANIVNYIKTLIKSQGKINFSSVKKVSSHDSLTRTMHKKFQWQKILWKIFSYFLNCIDAYLILDDTVIEKPYSKASNKNNSITRYCFSNKQRKTIIGINVVVLLVVIKNLRIPLAIRIYDGTKTKTELALELFSYARNSLKFRKKMVLFDSWYSSKRILKRLCDYGWYFVCRVKKNRKISDEQAKRIFDIPYGFMRGKIGKINVLLVKHRKHYLITNKLSLGKKAIRTWYSKRWKIEEMNKVMNHFGAKSCQSRVSEVWYNHLYLIIMSICFIELKRKGSIYKAKSEIKLRKLAYLFIKLKKVLVSSA